MDARPEITVFYVLERYALHIFEAAAVYLLAVAVFYWIVRKLGWKRMQGWWALVAPAVLAFLPISFREVFDVYHGDPIYKSFFDWSSWMVGFGLAIWGIYRLTPLFWDILQEIHGRPIQKYLEEKVTARYGGMGKLKPSEPWPDPPPKSVMTPKPLEWGCPECGTISVQQGKRALLGKMNYCPNCKKLFTDPEVKKDD